MKCREGYHVPKGPHEQHSCYHIHPKLAPEWLTKQQNQWKRKNKKVQVINYHALLNLWITAADSPDLILDSGASSHMFNSSDFFTSVTEMTTNEEIKNREAWC